MTDPLERIEAYFLEFGQAIVDCRSGTEFRAGDWKEAHAALGRLRDRYLHEKKDLTPEQRAALQKVFEDDVFIAGMMAVRQVGEHVKHVSQGAVGPRITTLQNAPIQLTVSSSAMAMFAAPTVVLHDVNNVPHRIDHRERLKEAQRRIGLALAKAKNPRKHAGACRLRSRSAAARGPSVGGINDETQ